MAESPAHTFGQYLGNLLEALFLPELDGFCLEYGLYLDKHGVRPVRKGKKERPGPTITGTATT